MEYDYMPISVCERSRSLLPLLRVKSHTQGHVAVPVPCALSVSDREVVLASLEAFFNGKPFPALASAVQDTAALVALDFMVRFRRLKC